MASRAPSVPRHDMATHSRRHCRSSVDASMVRATDAGEAETMRWPEVDRDRLTVGSVVDRNHAAAAGIFLPVEYQSGIMTWSEIASRAGVELAAETTWSELASTEVAQSLGLRSPYGEVHESVILELI